MVKLTVPDDGWTPSLTETPFAKLGGADAVRALAMRFYDVMEQDEPALAQLHRLTPEGRIASEPRERFALFLVGWLGGPQDYTAQHGHPRLRLRHGAVPVNTQSRDAWLRCIRRAMDLQAIQGGLRQFLDARFAETADFLRNT